MATDDERIRGEELANVVSQQSTEMDDCHDPDGKMDCVPSRDEKIDYVPLINVRPENGENRRQGFHYEEGTKEMRRNTTSTWLTYTRKRGRPAGSKSAKSMIEQEPALFLSSSHISSHSKDDKDDDFEPPMPTSTRKRVRQARSKPAKCKRKQKQLWVDSSSSEGKKDMDDDFEPEVSDDEDSRKKYARVKGTGWDRAVELEEKLSAEGLSFVKLMKQSHVVRGFWLGLPAGFCKKHLPNHDVDILLEDEEGEICDTKYKAYKTGLSGGWHGFVRLHHLKVDNVLVFQLVSPTKFKVYIFRENKFTTTDGALGLLSLDKSTQNNLSKKVEESSHKDAKSKKALDGGIKSPCLDIDDFTAVKSYNDFRIIVDDGFVVLPDRLRMTYYELCYAQKAYIHGRLLKEKGNDLAIEAIVETIKIAEAIRASSVASLEELVGWKKTLESLESMGMDVALMRNRVDELLGLLSAPSSTTVVPEGYEDAKIAHDRATKELRDLESRLSILKYTLKDINENMEEMVDTSAKQKDLAVRKLATAPW